MLNLNRAAVASGVLVQPTRQMRQLFFTATLACLLLAKPGRLTAQDLLEANDAFDRGEFVTAMEVYEDLAANGEAEAQYRLGLIYEQGLGTDVDFRAASNWYQQAAAQQSLPALAALSQLYLTGQGVIQDFKESLRLNEQAAQQGYAPSQHNLGVAHANGVGTFRDPIKAHMWFNLASANGYPAAASSRQRLASSMAQGEVLRAQDRAKQCMRKQYTNC